MSNFNNLFPRYEMSNEGQTDDPAKAIYAQLLSSIGGALPVAAMSALKMIGPGAYNQMSDPLMGFNKLNSGFQKGYADQRYPYNLPVQVQMRGMDPFADEIKGLNFQHALSRALRNWEGASIVPMQSNLK